MTKNTSFALYITFIVYFVILGVRHFTWTVTLQNRLLVYRQTFMLGGITTSVQYMGLKSALNRERQTTRQRLFLTKPLNFGKIWTPQNVAGLCDFSEMSDLIELCGFADV